jgi:diguanylate cyclase (GGDEF)-like protein
MTMIYEVAKTINHTEDLGQLFDPLFLQLEKFLGINDCFVWLWSQDSLTFNIVYNKKNELLEDFINIEDTSSDVDFKTLNENSFIVYDGKQFIEINRFRDDNLKLATKSLIIFMPLINREGLFGVIGFSAPELIGEYFVLDQAILFSIISIQIATAITGFREKEALIADSTILVGTRDIAKIIEFQHELTYVIPLMGEIIDKYLDNALAYVFLNGLDGEFQLSWPGSYSNSVIDPLLDKVKKIPRPVMSYNRRAMAFPLLDKGNLYGAIVADAKVVELSESEIRILKELSNQCSVTIGRASAYAETVKHATVDALTGLDNRRQLDKRLMQEASVFLRTKRPLSVLMIDLDHFKQVNDTHGHGVGDYVLKQIAKIIKKTIREYDVAGRYGGEEFAVLLPDTGLDGARKLAERLREEVEQTEINIGKFSGSKTDTLNLTLSVGVSTFADANMNPADIYEEADIALYKAKQEGRNMVVLFSQVS